ncbi:alkene reductase [Aureibacter tunicatorum]|uniref:N-ethylmaleimide reductase n=1 Tax=Aureibacter tunicatorum TaxID=866807 RepID=A0AAE3XRN1_9BACT|nr:alkene reductase [Aureibacter tunicatorum]MDR6241400.1 N-ethylmaleimide reductase [Aureibacter tunicatorum]BDD06755.1 alkene reductase [Aureibacter tunicatorum]
MNTDILFTPFESGNFKMSNRIAMAPMTRSRTAPGDVPIPMMATYYAQRASAGLIISEGTPVSAEARGYSMTPGIYTAEQIEGWKMVTKAVHDKGGKIFVQLWHVGRRATTSVAGTKPLAPSALKVDDKIFGPLADGGYGMIETDIPKAMSLEDIERTKNDFLNAAKNAMEAGFDGIEIHGAHGYLFDQFFRRDCNERTDKYGGSIENRARLAVETVEMIVNEIGSDKVAIRISPFLAEGTGGVHDDEMPKLALYLMQKLSPLRLAYLHLSENISNFKHVPDSFRVQAREAYQHPIMVCGDYTKESGAEIINKDWADLVAYGRPYIINPDLVERFKNNYPLNEMTEKAHSQFYGGGEEGYTNYLPYR